MEIKKVLPYDKDWVKRDINKLENIILHHADDYDTNVKEIEGWHVANGWSGGFGYNFFVDKEGIVYEGRPIDVQTAGASGHNLDSIHICAEGNYHPDAKNPKKVVDKTMPEAQRKAIVELIKHLKKTKQYKILKHSDVNSTSCPGMYYPFQQIVDEVNYVEPKLNVIIIAKQIDKKVLDDLVRNYNIQIIETK